MPWGTVPKVKRGESSPISGVYIVSLTESCDSCGVTLPNPPWAESEFEKWLEVCPGLTLDNRQPTIRQLMDRISLFWLPEESNLYIGKATALRDRVPGYYKTPIGASRPHLVATFSNCSQTWIGFGCITQFAEIPKLLKIGCCATFAKTCRQSRGCDCGTQISHFLSPIWNIRKTSTKTTG